MTQRARTAAEMHAIVHPEQNRPAPAPTSSVKASAARQAMPWKLTADERRARFRERLRELTIESHLDRQNH